MDGYCPEDGSVDKAGTSKDPLPRTVGKFTAQLLATTVQIPTLKDYLSVTNENKEDCYSFHLPNNPQERSQLVIYGGECANVWEDIPKLQNSLTYHVGLVQRGQSIH